MQISVKKENQKTDYKLSKIFNIHNTHIGVQRAIIHANKRKMHVDISNE